MPKDPRQLLRPEHFSGLITRLSDLGLRFSHDIGREERECAAIEFETRDTDAFMAKLATIRPATRTVLNPEHPSGQSLLRLLKDAQEHDLPDERISLDYGLSDAYEFQWKRVIRDGEDQEGQHLVLVAYDSTEPVGCVGWDVSALHDRDDKNLLLSFSLDLVYVLPRRRGEGFGLDLSIGCSLICQDVLKAAYRAVPAGTLIQPHIYADYESEGGEAFAKHLCDSLEFEVYLQREHGRRDSIRVEDPSLDAGY